MTVREQNERPPYDPRQLPQETDGGESHQFNPHLLHRQSIGAVGDEQFGLEPGQEEEEELSRSEEEEIAEGNNDAQQDQKMDR